MKYKVNKKGVSEIVSQILLILISVIVIGIILSAIIPEITQSKSHLKFEESKRLRDTIYDNIQEVYTNPIGFTKEIDFSLENLTLVIDANTNAVDIYTIIEGNFYKDGLRLEETSEKYTYRKGQKLYSGITFKNIDLVRSYTFENKTNIKIYLRKTSKDQITVLLENVTEDNWFTSSNLGLYEETPSNWLYRKKILIDHNKVDGNLTNFPVLIYLEDEDLKSYAKNDGTDIIFTSKDGKIKLKREIEDYNSEIGTLVAWVQIPELSFEEDTVIYLYFGNEDANESDDSAVWNEDYIGVWHSNDLTTSTIEDSTVNNNTGTKIAVNEPLQVLGKIGNAQTFDGIDDSINTYINSIYCEKSTISFWANFNNNNGPLGNGGIIFGSNYWVNNRFSITQHNSDKRLMFTVGTGHYAMLANAFPETGTWNHYVFTYDSIQENWADALHIYVNGDEKSFSSSGETQPLETTNNIYISGSALFTGILDEVAFSNNLHSASWIKTEYNNQSEPTEFINIGILEKS